jgi:chitin synthase
MTANGELSVRSDAISQYEGSDTMSIASSDDDHWGTQIGGYNENHPLYPPPPVGLNAHGFASAESIAATDLEAMLEQGFDERKGPNSSSRLDGRYQPGNGYAPLSRSTSPGRESPISPLRPTNAVSSARDEHQTHAKKRSGGRSGTKDYGPLGPLDPSSRF